MPQLKTKTESLVVRVTPEDKTAVEALAAQLGVSLSGAVLIMIRGYLQAQQAAEVPR
jgi:hypothetical protein